MKHIVKGRLIGLLITMVLVISLAVPTEAKAATSKITLKNGKAAPGTIYTGHSYNLKVAGTKVEFSSSDDAIATIGTSTGKLVAKAPGSVKVTAKSKKTGKVVATKTFTVKQRAIFLTLNLDNLNMAPEDVATITATLVPDTSTDVIRFYSTDKSVATVDLYNGVVTAKATGTTTIKVFAKATKATSNSNKYNLVSIVNVVVTEPIGDLESTELIDSHKVRFTFNGNVRECTKDEFDVREAATNLQLVVRSVESEITEDSGTYNVYLTFYSELNETQLYNVIFHGNIISFGGKTTN